WLSVAADTNVRWAASAVAVQSRRTIARRSRFIDISKWFSIRAEAAVECAVSGVGLQGVGPAGPRDAARSGGHSVEVAGDCRIRDQNGAARKRRRDADQ